MTRNLPTLNFQGMDPLRDRVEVGKGRLGQGQGRQGMVPPGQGRGRGREGQEKEEKRRGGWGRAGQARAGRIRKGPQIECIPNQQALNERVLAGSRSLLGST